MRPKYRYILFFVFLTSTYTQAQDKYSVLKQHIDSLIIQELPKSALEKVHELKKTATTDQNDVQKLNAVLYELNLTAQIEKNLERNIQILNKEIDSANFPIKAILQSVLAETYWNYYKQNRSKIINRTYSETKDGDFKNWDFKTLFKQVSELYDTSISSREILQNIVIDGYNTVLTDSINQNLRPSLYDLLAHRALAFYNNQESQLSTFNLRKTINEDFLFDNNSIFYSSQSIEILKADSLLKKTIEIYQTLYQFHHKKKHTDALADLYLNRVLHIPRYYIDYKNRDSLLLNALNKIEQQYPSSGVIADVLYEKALIYERKQMHHTAHPIYQEIIEKFPNSIAAENTKVRLFILEKKELNIRLDGNNIPDKNILATVDFKNITKAKYTIYKVDKSSANSLIIKINDRASINREIALGELRNQKSFRIVEFQFPDLKNFKQNTTEIRIEPLPVGNYFIVLEHDSIKKEDIKLAYFNVTNIAGFVNSGNGKQKIRVADRTTGAPLKGASVIVYNYESYNNKNSKEVSSKGKTDDNGFLITPKDKFNSYEIRFKNDIWHSTNVYTLPYRNNQSNTEEETSLFTDREIYRPGQIIYFKGLKFISSTENPKICAGDEVEVIFGNRETVFEKIKLRTNEFGTFSGSFNIPSNLLSGSYYIKANKKWHYFKIEEYKRPAFYITFSPAVPSLTPKDTVKITGTAASYAGYNLPGAKVVYTIYKSLGYYTQRREVYHTDSIKTNWQGKFLISFIPDSKETIYTYSITARITDISGETQENTTSVSVGNPSIRLTTSISSKNFITDTLKIPFSLTDLNRNKISGRVKVRIYNVNNNPRNYYIRNMVPIITNEEYSKYFPGLEIPGKNSDPENFIPIFEKEFIVDAKNTEQVLNVSGVGNLPSGTYNISLIGYNEAGDSIGSGTRTAQLITPKIGTPVSHSNWLIQQTEKVKKGENAIFYVGFNSPCTFLMEVYENGTLKSFNWIKTTGNYYEKVLIPYNGEVDLKVVFSTMCNNKFHTQTEEIRPFKTDKALNIQMLTFRDKVQPGDRDKWRVKVTDENNQPVKAEVLASMYDASLDGINGNTSVNNIWRLNNNFRSNYLPSWVSILSNGGYGMPLKNLSYNYHYIDKTYSKLKYLDYNYSGLINRIAGKASEGTNIQIRGTSSSSFGEGPVNQLNEVNVIGYGTAKRADLTGAVAGVSVTEKGDSNELFTSVDNIMNDSPAPLPQQIRKNFEETAFFYPHIVTDEKGEAEFEFTFPESLTTWNFRLFAHTKDLKTNYTNKKITAQKTLMVTTNLPRFFREGDDISLITKITNLASNKISGQSKLQFIDDYTKKQFQTFTSSFQTESNTSVINSYRIKIPEGSANITYRASAESSIYYDGEEKIIPVLSKKISLSESNSFILKSGEKRDIKLDDFIATDDKRKFKSMVFSVKTNPLWEVVDALPYLKKESDKFKNTNSIFNTFFLNEMVLNIRKNHYQMVYPYYSTKKDSSKTKTPFLGNNPWFTASDIYQHEENLKRLFKGNNPYTEQSVALSILQKIQRADGSFSWFEDCNFEDRYITQNIIVGFGQLQKISTGSFLGKQKEQIIKKALSYLDNQLIKSTKTPNSTDVHGWYARSFHKDSSELKDFQETKSNYLDYISKNRQKYTEYEQGLIAYTFLNFNQKEQALPILKSLKEKALFTEQHGAYWAKEQNSHLWARAEIEKQALMINLFSLLDDEKDFAEQLKTWLILNKQTTHWKTSSATSAACFAILTNGNYKTVSKGLKLFSGGKSKPENRITRNGNYNYLIPLTNNKPDFPFSKIENESENIMRVSLNYDFQQDLEEVKSHNNGLTLRKKYFKKDEKGVLKEISATNKLKIGDKITVRLYINADRNFEYIHLKDERPSGTETTSLLSSYKYTENLFYYTTTKDTSTDFFFNYIPKGSYVIDYDLYCTQEGNFSSGIGRIESMYAPEFGAHTENHKIEILK